MPKHELAIISSLYSGVGENVTKQGNEGGGSPDGGESINGSECEAQTERRGNLVDRVPDRRQACVDMVGHEGCDRDGKERAGSNRVAPLPQRHGNSRVEEAARPDDRVRFVPPGETGLQRNAPLRASH